MNKYGVCICDLDGYESQVTELEIFETHDEAFERYKERLFSEMQGYLFRDDLWIVCIESENNRIVQFDQLVTKSRCKIMEIPTQ